jgi:hypothetical protein
MRFIDVVKLAISQWEYYPEVVAGCKVDQLTQQKFTFSRP